MADVAFKVTRVSQVIGNDAVPNHVRLLISRPLYHVAILYHFENITTCLRKQGSAVADKPARRAASRRTSKVDAQCDKLASCDRTKLTTLRIESRQFAAIAPAFNRPTCIWRLRWR